MKREKIKKELDELNIEKEAMQSMSDAEICETHNVDFAEEAREAIDEEIKICKSNLADLDKEDEEYNEWDDHGFASCEDYYRFVG